jgi:Sulfotransferase family
MRGVQQMKMRNAAVGPHDGTTSTRHFFYGCSWSRTWNKKLLLILTVFYVWCQGGKLAPYLYDGDLVAPYFRMTSSSKVGGMGTIMRQTMGSDDELGSMGDVATGNHSWNRKDEWLPKSTARSPPFLPPNTYSTIKKRISNISWTRLRTPAPLVVPVNKTSTDWRGYNATRTILFLHVGKAGGMTLRTSTSLVCYNRATTHKDPVCASTRFPPNATLANQVKYVAHMDVYQYATFKNSTSFMVSLRNPVDRIISAYRYSHPENCASLDGASNNETIVKKAWGCRIKAAAARNGTAVYKMYNVCYPLPGMEDFAQNTLSPYPTFNTHEKTMTTEDIENCRAMATQECIGNGHEIRNKHAFYNYKWYYDISAALLPYKEVFGVRTEYEMEDLVNLDLAIGGVGNIGGEVVSHGSEGFAPSLMSPTAYQKLCCMMEDEILYYHKFLDLALNINDTEVETTMDNVKRKCNITTSWDIWRSDCKARMKMDKKTTVPQGYDPIEKKISLMIHRQSSSKRKWNPPVARFETWPKKKFNAAERVMTLVQIGTSLATRRSTSLYCMDGHTQNYESCVQKTFPANATFARTVRHSVSGHVSRSAKAKIKESTSFLAVLENPVDRLIAAYWTNHPANCSPHLPDSRSCRVKEMADIPGSEMHHLFHECFPSPSMEMFIQSSMSPYGPMRTNMTSQQLVTCRALAHETATGSSRPVYIPEMSYNYGYYLEQTLISFPSKEFFGIRQEHELQDMINLDRSFGGAGKVEPHGDSPPPLPKEAFHLSKEAYEKLCCVMESEVVNYSTMLRNSMNLDRETVRKTMSTVRQKCGFRTSWVQWQTQCRERKARDKKEREIAAMAAKLANSTNL